jgi:diketogulonate reductase-like aldo/keto reductase
MYGNEAEIGLAIKECIDEGIVKREELFITTKLWIDGRGRVKDELKESLQRLKLDYVDMYIMHFMVPDIDPNSLEVKKDSLSDVWRALEKCQKEALTRSIGVSNCTTVLLMEILSFCEIKPASN